MTRSRPETNISEGAKLTRREIGTLSDSLQEKLLPNHSLKNYAALSHLADVDGEKISTDYKELLSYLESKPQTAKNNAERADVHYDYAWHLSVLRIYYYYCSQQAEENKDAIKYLKLALPHSERLIEHYRLSLSLYTTDKEREDTQTQLDASIHYDQVIRDDIATKKQRPRKRTLSESSINPIVTQGVHDNILAISGNIEADVFEPQHILAQNQVHETVSSSSSSSSSSSVTASISNHRDSFFGSSSSNVVVATNTSSETSVNTLSNHSSLVSPSAKSAIALPFKKRMILFMPAASELQPPTNEQPQVEDAQTQVEDSAATFYY